MPKYHIWTIGCQMNKAESARLASRLEGVGYEATEDLTEADLVVINSCVVRQSAENRVLHRLRKLRQLKLEKPSAIVAVTGCFVDSDIAHLKETYPFVDYFFRAGEDPPWLEKPPSLVLPRPSPSVYVPISQGCDNFCTYCIVPYRRGREKSRPMEEIVCEVETLVGRGAKEVVLLGQNVDSYGHDLPGSPDLADLLVRLNAINGLMRLRFLTNHPKDMSEKLIGVIAALDKVCEQLSLPVQSGSDRVLAAMGRGYTVAQYRELVRRLRETVPGIAISTDVIVGFPGETEADFRATLELLSELRFATVHVAGYSPRPGTFAARHFPDDIPPQVKKARLNEVEKLQEKIQMETNAALLGEVVEVLVEGNQRGRWYGRTRTDRLVFFSHGEDLSGRLVKVRVEETSPWSLRGRLEAD